MIISLTKQEGSGDTPFLFYLLAMKDKITKEWLEQYFGIKASGNKNYFEMYVPLESRNSDFERTLLIVKTGGTNFICIAQTHAKFQKKDVSNCSIGSFKFKYELLTLYSLLNTNHG